MVAKADEPPQQDLVWSAPWQMMDNFPDALTETPTYPDVEPPTAVPPKADARPTGSITATGKSTLHPDPRGVTDLS